MKELSLHILDIAQNAVTAGADKIEITIDEQIQNNLYIIQIKDNGCGMDKDLLDAATSPFTTTRKTRAIGMGIPLFKMSAEQSGGSFEIRSEKGKGTVVTASYKHNHINRQPLGDMAQTIAAIVAGNDNIDFLYRHIYEGSSFIFDTAQIKKILGDKIKLGSPDIIVWIIGYIKEGLNNIGLF